MQSIDNVLKLRKGLKPDDPNPDIFDILWAKKLSKVARDYTVTGNPISFLAKKAQTAKSTKVTLKPVQDLHGYSNPWPAGGGKNKFDKDALPYISGKYIMPSGAFQDSVNYNIYKLVLSAGSYIVSKWDDTEGLRQMVYAIASYDSNDSVVGTVRYREDVSTTSRLTFTFTVPAEAAYTLITLRVSSYDVQVESGSTATAYVPYSNICPISGRTGVEIKGCGKNLCNYEDMEIVTLVDNTRPGVIVGGLKAGGTYKIKAFTEPSVNQYIYARIQHADGTQEDYKTIVQARRIYTRTFTVAEGDVIIIWNASSGSTIDGSKTIFAARQIMMTYGETEPETYEAYTESNDVTITFPAVGKNKFNKDDSNMLFNGYISSSDNILTTSTTSTNTYRSILVPCLPNTTYTISNPLGKRFYVGYSHETPSNGTSIYGFIKDNEADSLTITTDSEAQYIVSYVYYSNVETYSMSEILGAIQVETGSYATTYEPYTNTCYGGTLDVETGVLTMDEQMYVFDTSEKINSITQLSSSIRRFFRKVLDNTVIASTTKPRGCSHLVNADVTSSTSVSGYYAYTSSSYPTQGFLQFRDATLFSDLDECKAWFNEQLTNGNPVQCWFTLATPATIQLTPSQIQILKGQNTIWIEDAGATIALTYKN